MNTNLDDIIIRSKFLKYSLVRKFTYIYLKKLGLFL